MLDEPPKNEKLHVEVVSTSSRIGLLHPKVYNTCVHLLFIVASKNSALEWITFHWSLSWILWYTPLILQLHVFAASRIL